MSRGKCMRMKNLIIKGTAILLAGMVGAVCIPYQACVGRYPSFVWAQEETQPEREPTEHTIKEELELYARGAVLMDGDSGRILYGKNEDDPMPMASTTKIMTCILALEAMENPEQVCEVSSNAAAQPQVKLGMVQGDTFYLKDLLYSLMLESHNDSAVCIAESVSGSVEEFAALMNRKAAELGCRDTHFVTPNGLDAEDAEGIHHTTAAELARIMRYCIGESPASEQFLEITETDSYSFTNQAGSRSYSCVNHNAFLHMMEGVLSGKTGFTGNAGYCYVCALEQDGKQLVVALLACGWPNHKRYKWTDTRKLMEYGLERYEKRTIADEKTELPAITVTDGQKSVVTLTAETSPFELLLMPEEKVEKKISLVPELAAPVDKGIEVGSISYLVEGEIYESFPVYTAKTVDQIDYLYCLHKIWMRYLLKNE